MKARLLWAQAHKEWTQAQWARVLWSDESSFTIYPNPTRKFVWIRKGRKARNPQARIPRKQVAPTVKFGKGKVMVWGCFYAGGVANLKEIDKTLNGDEYHKILVHRVMPLIKKKTLAEPTSVAWVFQQDGASVHRATPNLKYLRRKAEESGATWTTMEWPAQSPDLNPIENLWHYIKERLRKYPHPPSSKRALFTRIKTEWNKLGEDALQPYVNSMQQRCKAVIEARGGSLTC